MLLQNYRYQCGNCKNVFKYPHLLGEAYGEFLLHTKTGKIGYCMAIKSEEFSEVSKIVEDILASKPLTTGQKIKVLHKVFGVACDLSEDNSQFQLYSFPPCPQCHSQNMFSWEDISPPEYLEMDIPHVTHHRWNQLNADHKRALIAEAVASALN